MGEPQYLTYPSLQVAQQVFTLASPYASLQSKQSSLQTLQHGLRENKMAPLYAYLAHPQTGKLNASGEGGSAVMSPTLSRQNTAMSGTVGTRDTPGPEHQLRRTSSINAPSMVGVLGGKTDSSVELPWDEKLYEELKADNEKELDTIQKEEDEAVESAGEIEIQTAQGKRAEFYARIGDKDKALESFEKLFEKIGILGTKIDIVLAVIRIGLFFDDKLLVKKNVDRAATLVESGGDWDRRNRLKAYQGLHLLTIRAHGQAAPLLLDSLSTFTSTELCPYSSLVVYATLAGSVALPRRDFKSRVVDAPEIRAVFGSDAENADRLSAFAASGPAAGDEEMADASSTTSASATPKAAVNLTTLAAGSADASAQAQAEPQIDFRPLATLIQSLYAGNYTPFFHSLAAVSTQFLETDRYLYEHRRHYVREMRLLSYTQLLSSYRVVSLASMAENFGVSVDWLDKDLAVFIAGGRLGASIDRVKGVVETKRVDGKERQYGEVVARGDGLITKLQKYGQVVRLRGSERG